MSRSFAAQGTARDTATRWPRRLVLMSVLALGAAGAAGAPAAAQGWPQPAAGLSVTGDPEILFTFDDGPNPKTTPKVLDTLRQYGVQAVFFGVGRMVEHPGARAVIERIVAEGHIIANHTMRHGELCRLDEAEAEAEIDEGYRALHDAAAMPIPWFRTPYGARCARLDAQLAERKVTHFHWDIDPQEWRHGNAKRTIAYLTRVLGRAQGREVVLMHDTKQATVKALPEILQWIQEENQRREAEGRRQIRIVSASQYAQESLAPGVWKLLLDVAPSSRWGATLASVLP
ncbi:MAG: polysaccharide deacetylase family protein [Myxococcales bacterium]|nr:polysaccharide deacetylase family protein [Myxococcales bacterium]